MLLLTILQSKLRVRFNFIRIPFIFPEKIIQRPPQNLRLDLAGERESVSFSKIKAS